MPKPYYERGGVQLYHGRLQDITPSFTEKGIRIGDFPYSAHTHDKVRSNARVDPLWSGGDGRVYKASKARKVDLGFEYLTPELRRFAARESARLASRFTLDFSDTESDWLWRTSLVAAGLDYYRTAFWRKVNSTPQFTGRIPAVAVEAITICHTKGFLGGAKWNGGGRHGWYEQGHEESDFAAFTRHGGELVYDVPIVLERFGQGKGEARVHTTQKPEALMTQLVEEFTNPGELIYDWTCGFATTAVAALKASGGPRRAVLIEQDERWCEAAAKRLDAEIGGVGYTPQMKSVVKDDRGRVVKVVEKQTGFDFGGGR